jgi:hypothetical protein
MSVCIPFYFLSLIFLLPLYLFLVVPLCLSFVLRHLFCSLHNFLSVSRFRFEFAFLLSLSRWLISMISVLFLIWLYFVESIFSLKGPSIEKSRICRSRISAWLVDTSLVKLKTDPMSVWLALLITQLQQLQQPLLKHKQKHFVIFLHDAFKVQKPQLLLKAFLVGMLWEKSLKWPRTG